MGHRTQNTHTESKQVKYNIEMIQFCVFTLFFCSITGRHFLIQTEDRGQDYNDKAVQPIENRDETGAACHYKEVLKEYCAKEPRCWCNDGQGCADKVGTALMMGNGYINAWGRPATGS